jgi:[acyl-carrier-protein] S-malonyltransferase
VATGHDHPADSVVATVDGVAVPLAAVDEREAQLRASAMAASLPAAGTSEGRQLRRWLTQLLVTEHVVARESAGLDIATAPTEDDLLPDAAARLELGSVAAAALSSPHARALFALVTAGVTVTDDDVSDYHRRNPDRHAPAGTERDAHGWHRPPTAPSLDQARAAIMADLLGAARRRAFRTWLDARRAELVTLTQGYEHPGDPGQPDNTHKH